MAKLQKHMVRGLLIFTFFSAFILISDTAQMALHHTTSFLACTIGAKETCAESTSRLARFTPQSAAEIQLKNCTENKSVLSCMSASSLFYKMHDSVRTIASLSKACELGETDACQQGTRFAKKWVDDSKSDRASKKERQQRLQSAFRLYAKGCEMGQGESCTQAARSPLTNSKSSYAYLYKGCYKLKHASSCIDLASYFKNKGQIQLARNAVGNVCKGQQSLACSELVARF